MEMKATIYLKTETGTERRFAQIPLCQVPQVGDKLKVEDVWWTVSEVEQPLGNAVCNVHVE